LPGCDRRRQAQPSDADCPPLHLVNCLMRRGVREPPFGAVTLPLAQGISGVRERRFCAFKTTMAGPALPHRPALV